MHETAGVQVSEFTLSKWRRDDGWIEEAEKQDAMVREAVVREAASRKATGLVDLAEGYEELAAKALDRIREAIDTLPIRKVADLRILASIALDLQARADILRATAIGSEERNSTRRDLFEIFARYER